ncbi:MAG TPA: hypothetical protein VF691_00575 [Cytophagaceae bacterium]|jgi:predicted chitinase
MKFEYPIKIAGESQEEIETQVSYLLGSRNSLGFYPIGRLNNWHGGIHIEGEEALFAIADGRVIAYRFLRKNLVETIEGIDYPYSNGFVLIQHDYKSPKGLEFTFYSLYHHLSCYDETKSKLKPAFIEGAYKVAGTIVKSGQTGEHFYGSATGTNNLGFIPNDTELKIIPTPGANGNYRKFTCGSISTISGNTYIHKGKIKPIIASSELDQVKNCVKPIKAGELIGYPGMFSFEKDKTYRASHIEIFASEKVADFLKGKEEDIQENQNYFKVTKGKALKEHYPSKITKGWNIKLLESSDNYSRVQLHEVESIVPYSQLKDEGKKNAVNKNIYSPKEGNSFGTVNGAFDGILSDDPELVFVANVDENVNGVVTKKLKLSYHPLDHTKYWVANSKISGNGDIRKISSDINELYLEKPVAGESGGIINTDVFIRKINARKYKDSENKVWYHIKCSYLKDGTREIRKGWLKENDIQLVSAYDWKQFGFEIREDLEDKYVYDLEELPAFLKEIIDEVDTAESEVDNYDVDRKGILTVSELRSALRKTHISRRLSQLVCKHTNEWAYESSTVKAEVESFLDKGIKLEDDDTRKEGLNKKKKKILDSIDLKVPKLNIWSEISNGPLAGTTPANSDGTSSTNSNNLPPRKFPESKVVYHFHPIAFVEQMKRMEKCFCDMDITEEVFSQIFGNGPWFTAKVASVNMADYPQLYKLTTAKLVKALNSAMKKYDINSCLQKAHFLAQCAHESSHFQSTLEYADGNDYDSLYNKDGHDKYQKYLDFLDKYGGDSGTLKAKKDKIEKDYESCRNHYDLYEANKAKEGFDLTTYEAKHGKYAPYLVDKNLYNSYKNLSPNYSNYKRAIEYRHTAAGDGPRYKGKGLLQLTWKGNYEDYKSYTGIDYVGHPEKLADNIDTAADVSGWFWRKKSSWGDLNPKAERDDLLAITVGINGGIIGLEDRYKKTKMAVKHLGVEQCGKHGGNAQIGKYSFDTSKIKESKWYESNKVAAESDLVKIKKKLD